MKREDLLQTLKTQLVGMLNDLIESFPSERELFLARVFLEAVDKTKLMDGFVEYVLPWKTQINNNDTSYFKDNPNIFGMFPSDKVDRFRALILSENFGLQNIGVLFQYFQVFVALAEQYKNLKK